VTRTVSEASRFYKYSFAQTLVFGLPVLALQFFGYSLGPADADRWVPILQAILTGWIIYIAAAGMLFERRGLTADFVVALLAVLVYISSLVSVCHILATARLWYRPLLFHVVVMVLGAWTGLQWWRTSRASHRLHESDRGRESG
jgi:hypothetical protein